MACALTAGIFGRVLSSPYFTKSRYSQNCHHLHAHDTQILRTMSIIRTIVRHCIYEVSNMENQRQEFLSLIDKLTDYQVGYILPLAKLIGRLSEYQTRYISAFLKRRFNL